MTVTIKAIETEYAGCRFRSRLEARWAVVFDHLGIRWEYEPEGLELDGVRYLPDFRLPDMDGLYAEVKGRVDKRGLQKVVQLAFHGRGVMVLGEVPRSDELGPHFVLFTRDVARPGVQAFYVSFRDLGEEGMTVLPFGWPIEIAHPFEPAALDRWCTFLNRQAGYGDVIVQSHIAAAFDAGRSARFEHGERG